MLHEPSATTSTQSRSASVEDWWQSDAASVLEISAVQICLPLIDQGQELITASFFVAKISLTRNCIMAHLPSPGDTGLAMI